MLEELARPIRLLAAAFGVRLGVEPTDPDGWNRPWICSSAPSSAASDRAARST